MSDLVKGYTDFVGEEPNGHPYEVYHADDVQEVLQGKDARIAELEKEVVSLMKQMPCTCMWRGEVGPLSSKVERITTCYRCQRVGNSTL